MRWIKDPETLEPGNYAWKSKSSSPVHLCILSVPVNMEERDLNGWWLGPMAGTLYVTEDATKICQNCYYYTAKGEGRSKFGTCSLNPPTDNNWSNPAGKDKACSYFVYKA